LLSKDQARAQRADEDRADAKYSLPTTDIRPHRNPPN